MTNMMKGIAGLIVAGLVVLFVLLLFGCNDASAASIDLTCTPPQTRSDGTPLAPAEIAGYNWFLNGTQANQQPTPTCAYTMTAPDGTQNIQATTVDTAGRESILSPGVSKDFTTAPPNPPTVN